MKRTFVLIIISLTFVSTVFYPIEGLRVSENYCHFENYDFTQVDNLLEDAVNTIPLDGCVLLLIKDGQVIYDKAFGNYNINTVVPIASSSKLVSGILILKLVDEGVLSLDDKVSDWIPSFENRGGKDDITIRQCFSHTSGLPSSAVCIFHQEPPWDLELSANIIARRNMKEAAGTAFRYGSISMQVAGRVAELAGGNTWVNLYKEKITDPLGIESLVWNNDYPDTKNPFLAGGIAQITVEDYSRLLQMLLNGGSYNNKTILSKETVAELFKDQTKGVPIASSPYEERIDHPQLGYSIGAWIDIVDEDGKVVEISSTGAFGFHPWIDLNRNLVGVFLVKSSVRKVYDTESELKILIRDITSENKAPVIPDKPVGPSKIKPGISYTFNAVTTDPENENISYLFDWGDGTSGKWTSYVKSGESISLTHIWEKKGTYSIKVKAKDSNGTECRWSEPLSVDLSKTREYKTYQISLFDILKQKII